MPTFVYPWKCDGCGDCVDICPSDIMHMIPSKRKAYNAEPDMCWECYSCVKICPTHAIDVRGYSDFCPLDHKVTVLVEDERNRISWKIRFRNGSVKSFTFATRTIPWGASRAPQSYPAPPPSDIGTELLSREPDLLKTGRPLPTLQPPQQSRRGEG
jgi:adenylylsulfate reductase subunit B